ncbi:MAG TPA: HAMP domain-containing sensor histidine kinase [Ktedonobacterales bacterium]|nr:HAMP domain-containing sensor histidine kinase [Ktedonobacterales bacterium]
MAIHQPSTESDQPVAPGQPPVPAAAGVMTAAAGAPPAALWRWRFNPRSLGTQMAVGSALVALLAVALVAAIALVTTFASFNQYTRSQLVAETSRVAVAIGQGRPASDAVGPPNSAAQLGAFGGRAAGGSTVWIMDTSGHVSNDRPGRLDPQARDSDLSEISGALTLALAGHSSDGWLRGQPGPRLTPRIYAAAPIYAGGTAPGPIIGAVALTTPVRSGAAATFAGSVLRAVVVLALLVAAVAAAAAALFSRRVTRPLAQMAGTTARMAEGDYGARMHVAAPEELRTLASSFNDMAAALQRDVGELRRQEALRRDLIANVSHELATPLTAIQGFNEALHDNVIADPTEREETHRLIAREAARLRRLVDQMRQVALFEGGAAALRREPVHLPTLLGEALAVLAPELQRKRVTVEQQVPADLPTVAADSDRLTEIVLNLLDNALRHTPDGGTIDVAAAMVGNMVRASIADSGPGIAEADRERVFERFYRLDPSRAAATGGSGLGLAIVRSLVEAHGGAITLDAGPHGGARFSFTLPLAG